jgi:glucose 1-dehydrogenase
MSNETVCYPEFSGKRVLVTGASGGIGAAIARAFGHNGARVVVHYRTRQAGAEQSADVIRTAGGEAVMIQADLRSESAIERLVAESESTWGGIDILINNAGVVLKAEIADTAAAWWDDTMNINLRAPYLLARRVALGMIDRGSGGSIINNTSIHGHRSVEHFAAYAASKAALDAVTRVMALEWAEDSIRVNAVAPGVVPVERSRDLLEATADLWLPHIPLNRYGTVDDIANLTLFLCSNQASWISGQIYTADGGMTSRLDMPHRPRPEPPPAPDPVG